jgi:FKBP-type peptidyl-prolyl cis-trans isomerase
MQNQKGNISVIVSFVVVVVIMGLVIYMLVRAPKVKENPLEGISLPTMSAPSEKEAQSQQQQAQPKMQEPQQQVQVEPQAPKKSMDIVSKNGDTLSMNYTGHLVDGTVFDSNVDPKFGHVSPFEFKLGAGQVIKGWDEGLVGMKVGEKKTLTIPPEKGYGSHAMSSIPANSTLIFNVEVLGIK